MGRSPHFFARRSQLSISDDDHDDDVVRTSLITSEEVHMAKFGRTRGIRASNLQVFADYVAHQSPKRWIVRNTIKRRRTIDTSSTSTNAHHDDFLLVLVKHHDAVEELLGKLQLLGGQEQTLIARHLGAPLWSPNPIVQLNKNKNGGKIDDEACQHTQSGKVPTADPTPSIIIGKATTFRCSTTGTRAARRDMHKPQEQDEPSSKACPTTTASTRSRFSFEASINPQHAATLALVLD